MCLSIADPQKIALKTEIQRFFSENLSSKKNPNFVQCAQSNRPTAHRVLKYLLSESTLLSYCLSSTTESAQTSFVYPKNQIGQVIGGLSSVSHISVKIIRPRLHGDQRRNV